ncbi:19378_t:CDS:2 [Dentiscutata erythropus]|uniref:19378_t:CDS:1 n=1 Tax=Dentiscutata erythropus TaxID=1348616 RepID=A0A9N9F8H3_9GLOM|nr:19378_t:CDS:2 [Dentiscutata erythropus]
MSDTRFENEIKNLKDKIDVTPNASLLFLDIDNFKQYNEGTGRNHKTGDDVIKEFELFMNNELNKELKKKSVYSSFNRYGGDEYTILLNCPILDAYNLADYLLKKVRKHLFNSNNEKMNVTLSIGVCAKSSFVTTSESLINNADFAAKKAKRLGRNQVVLFRSTLYFVKIPIPFRVIIIAEEKNVVLRDLLICELIEMINKKLNKAYTNTKKAYHKAKEAKKNFLVWLLRKLQQILQLGVNFLVGGGAESPYGYADAVSLITYRPLWQRAVDI